MPFDANESNLNLVEVKESEIAGRGVFAKTVIPRGFSFGRYCPSTPYTMPPKVGEQQVSYYGFVANLQSPGYIDGMDLYGNIVHWTALVNHSSSFNVKFNDDATLSTTKKILPGQELFVDYGLAYWRAALPEVSHLAKSKLLDILDHKLRNSTEVQKLYKKLQVQLALDKLKERIEKVVAFRKQLTNEERTFIEEENEAYRLTLKKSKTFVELKEIARNKRNKWNRLFGARKRRRNKKEQDAFSSSPSLSPVRQEESEDDEEKLTMVQEPFCAMTPSVDVSQEFSNINLDGCLPTCGYATEPNVDDEPEKDQETESDDEDILLARRLRTIIDKKISCPTSVTLVQSPRIVVRPFKRSRN